MGEGGRLKETYLRGLAGRARMCCNADDAARGNAKRISPSFRRGSDAPAYAGCVDKADGVEICGWVCRIERPAEQCAVALCLGGLPIAFANTGIRRADIDAAAGVPVSPGFGMSLGDAVVRKGALDVLARHARSSPSGESEVRLALTMTVLGAGDDVAPGAGGDLQLPPGFAVDRALEAWAEFFDADLEVLSVHADSTEMAGLSPVPDGAPDEARVIAFYLPQFHTIPENDAWWGEGFTEWTGVATAKPYYATHALPHIPADLGFYDLRVREVRERQATLARSYGIYGFCYHFYWFSGRRILETPLELMLAEGAPDLPFCLCWANEPWSRRWDGSDQEILLDQAHDVATDPMILGDLMPYFEDPRYIRIDGRPILLVYRTQLMPDRAAFARELKAEARRRGLPGLFLCNVMSFGDTDATADGYDAAVEFPPHNTHAKEIDPATLEASASFAGKIFSYEDLVQKHVSRPAWRFPSFPGVMPRWDNTARKGSKGHVFHGATPELFEVWLRHAAETTCVQNPAAPLLFVNSWNEWGEGAHLEPDRRHRRDFLDAVRRTASGELRRPLPGDADNSDRWLDITTREHALLARQLASLDMLTKAPPLVEGTPQPVAALRLAVGGVGYVDHVNGRLAGHAVIVRRDADLALSGWFSGDRTAGSAHGEFGYVVLTLVSTRKSYFGPILQRHQRLDVADALKLRPDRAVVGYTARFDISALPTGVYGLKFIEVTERKATEINCSTTVHVVS
jgi:hypothetical protein